jgi:hypothetical protein
MRGHGVALWVTGAALALALGGCGHEKSGSTVAARPDYCPEEGASVPLAQLIAQPKKFKGCPVATEATLMGPYNMGSNFAMPSCAKKGRTLFQVGIPGQAPQPMGMFAAIASVSDEEAGTLFSAPGNALLRLRGQMTYKGAMMGTDLGGLSRCFDVGAVSLASAAK